MAPRFRRALELSLGVLALASVPVLGDELAGRTVDRESATPIVGAMVTADQGAPTRRVTVYSDEEGRFTLPAETAQGSWSLRARRTGWADGFLQSVEAGAAIDLRLARLSDPAELAAQLPANHWWALAMPGLAAEEQRVLKRECTYCHQQGSASTRRVRSREQWEGILAAMAEQGARLPGSLRSRLPDLLNAAFDPATAIPKLTRGWEDPETFAPPPSPAARHALIEEWELGGPRSMLHDVVLHPDGRLYAVDGTQDELLRLDPRTEDRAGWAIPSDGVPLGGVLGGTPDPGSNAHVGPHSLQVAADGSIWITLALGNRLARFDPANESFSIHPVADGFYPHTLRFDRRGRIWFTMSASNQVGRLDPASGEQVQVRLPARTIGQELALRLLPALLWVQGRLNLREPGGGFSLPVPYGIDIAPDGGVWFSQLNEDRIGRIDPETLAVELWETPFPAPRRLRFDPSGRLWIPSFTSAQLASFDLTSHRFEVFDLPVESRAGETPYAVGVDPASGAVWVCGANSDSLIRYQPEPRRFTVFPLPTRVTYTRELVFDGEGRVWTSNSNDPAWQIEGGQPIVLRLYPRD